MLKFCKSESTLFPPTDLYNEGWLLRLILNWFSMQKIKDHPLAFSESAKWFSEALLPTVFPPKSHKDPLGELWTHADGVIGHFKIGERGKGGLSLMKNAHQFVVLEAKMFSKLSPGVTHAKYFDQAARTVACISEVLRKAKRKPEELSELGFSVMAPQSQSSDGIFWKEMNKGSIID